MDWRTAFLAQAKSDYSIAVLLSESEGVPLCHTLHYLQMALEKFAKGIMAHPGVDAEPAHSHEGATRLIAFLKRRSPLALPFHRELGMNDQQRQRYLDGMLPAVHFLEQIAPAVANSSGTSVNAEYPWVAPAQGALPKRVIAPCHFSFELITDLAKLPKLLQLVGTIVRSYPD